MLVKNAPSYKVLGLLKCFLLFGALLLILSSRTFVDTPITLSGHVYDSNGNGVCGAQVSAYNATSSAYVTTQPDGSYSTPGLPGTYTVSMSYYAPYIYGGPCEGAATYPPYSRTFSSVTITGNTIQDFVLPPTYVVSGLVKDQNGTGLGDVTVTFSDPSYILSSVSTTTAADGSYSLTVYGGSYNVQLSKDNISTIVMTGLVVSSNMNQAFTIGPFITVSGHVYDSNSNGVCGAQVSAYNATSSAYVTTQPDGSYSTPGLPGTYTVTMSYNPPYGFGGPCDGMPTYPPYSTTFASVPITGDTVQDFVLPPAYVVSGMVKDQNGVGIGNVTVGFYDPSYMMSSVSTTTAADGSYSLTVYGGSYNVQLYKDNVSFVVMVGLVVTGNMNQDFTWGSSVFGSIYGKVINSIGAGIQNVWVEIYDTNYGYVSGVATNQDGNYFIGGISPGQYKVSFVGNSLGYIDEWYNDKADFNSADNIPVAPSTSVNVDAILSKPASIVGTVKDSQNNGMQDVVVTLYEDVPSGPIWVGNAVTDAEGNYMQNLLAGSYKVCFDAQRPEYINECYNDKADLSSADTISLELDETLQINAVLSKYGSITGSVTDAVGTGLQNVLVSLYDSNQNIVLSAFTDIDGNYSITNIPSGEYRIYFDAGNPIFVNEWYNDKPDFNSADIISITFDSTTQINAVLSQLGSISGTITDENTGLPIEATVTVYGPSDGLNTLTDGSGNYLIGSLAQGNYRVQACAFLYPCKYYGNTEDWDTATLVNVNLDQDVHDVNFTLAKDTVPPETQITSGPNEQVLLCQSSTGFTYTGSDNLTQVGDLQYAWRLDGASWSEFLNETGKYISNLTHGFHTFEVIAKDLAGNMDPSPAVSQFVTDLNPPVISNVSIITALSQATVNWDTDESASSQVEYGLSDSYGMSTPLFTGSTAIHSVVLSGLNPATTYHYRVISKDACGHESVSSDFTFDTVQDVIPPDTFFTSGPPFNGKACDSSVNLCWIGIDDFTSSSELQYSYSLDNGVWASWTSDTCHDFIGLTDGQHSVQVKAKDISGNEDTTPAVWNFNTDTTSPDLSNLTSVPRDYSAKINWNTYEPATSQVEYGETSSYGMTTSLDSAMTGTHSVTINGLTPQTSYHFRVKSNDGCREVISGDATFTTTDILYPNLHITQTDMPGTCKSLDKLDFKWLERNGGPGSAQGSWVDKIFLSTDDIFDSQDILIGTLTVSDGLDWETERWRTLTIDMPTMPHGTYYVIVSLDADNQIIETSETDNTLAKQIDYLKIKQLSVAPDQIPLNIIPGTAISGSFDLINLGATALTGITTSISNNPNITIQATPPSTLNGLTVQKVNYTVSASDESVLKATPVLTLSTAEGENTSVTFNINVIPRYPNLVTNPGYLETTMVRGAQTLVEFEITNAGAIATNNFKIVPPVTDWLSLVTPDNIASLGPGEKIKVGLALKPGETLPLGPYTGNIALSASNASASVGFRFTAISDKFGGLNIIAQDEFTYFADDQPPVANAAVKIISPYDGSTVAEGSTDTNGQFAKNDLPEGYYSLEISAEKHGTYNSNVLIVAGQVKEVKAFLPRQLVTYTWKVVPVETEDKYVITLEAVFESHVPAPVVTVDPMVLDVRQMTFDENGKAVVNYTITNHGYIGVHGTTIRFDAHPKYQATPINQNIGEIPAMTTITVPVTISKINAEPVAAASLLSSTLAVSGVDPCAFSGYVDFAYKCDEERPANVTITVITDDCGSKIPTGTGTGGGSLGAGGGGTPSGFLYEPPYVQQSAPCNANCDFSSSKERCFGGVGSGCSGNAWPFAPFVQHQDTCEVDGWMSAGSILHDICCLQTNNEGWSCSGLNKGDKTRCFNEWQEAWNDTGCGRQWRHTFGPYPIGNGGDDTNSDLRAPSGAKVNPLHQYLCQSGTCVADTNGNIVIGYDLCTIFGGLIPYCICQ